MDHLLQMRYAVYPDIEIPYLCGDTPYSPPFETYLQRLDFTTADLVDPLHSGKSESEVDNVFQAWLFFGLLETIFAPFFAPQRFVRQNSSGQAVITTQRLRQMTTYFFDERPDPYEPEWNNEWRQIQRLLQSVKPIMMEREKNCAVLGIPQTPTQLLIAVLFQFLAKRLSLDDVSNCNNMTTGLIERLMIERGWCSRQVAYLTESLNVECLYMISRIERPDPQFRHSKLCETDCIVNKVDRQTYRTTHVCADCSCEFLTADQLKLFTTLQDGYLPLIANPEYIDCNGISLFDTRQADKYVAISHVWSHGLGNPNDNSLPKCQLARLSKMVAGLYPNEKYSVPFWIDTICVPVNPPEARALAILNLRKTYGQADKVLVVDAYLEEIDSSTLSVVEIVLYIICSTWLTRLWTLQEGALAHSLHFQFADSIIDLAQIERTLKRDKPWKEFGSALGALINFRHADYGNMGIPASGLIQFLHLSVRNRSTSYTTDEALCLATLAGLGMENIARFSGEEDRMYNFWRLLKPTPSMMTFWTGPRLKTPGRRWAPATLRGNLNLKLDQRMAFEEETAGQGLVVTERGLMLCAPGLLLDASDTLSLGARFLVSSASQNTVFDVCKTGSTFESAVVPPNSECKDVEELASTCMALIVKRGKRLKAAEYDQTAIDDHAVLVRVSVEAEKPGLPLYAGFISNVSIGIINGLNSPTAQTTLGEVVQGRNLPKFAGTEIPDTQQWCLG